MRRLMVVVFSLSLISCDPPEQAEVQAGSPQAVLNLPEIESGMTVDTTYSSIRISAIRVDSVHVIPGDVELSADSLTAIVNVYADSELNTAFVDSVIDVYCIGRDICLIGANNGRELAIPFHTLHRFKPVTDTIARLESDFHEMFVEEKSLQVNAMSHVYESPEKYFRAFYGDAFNPLDSNPHLPRRESGRQIIEVLMLEATGWDDTDIKNAKDTAQSLAAYNEFVNKLEIYDKVGDFCIMRESVMECLPVNVTWGRMMQVFGGHYATISALRESAKRYLSDKIANEGDDPSVQFTNEDLRLLYPDRLRWNGRISGTQEHRYDPHLLSEFVWIADTR